MKLTEAQLESWRNDGYLIVPAEEAWGPRVDEVRATIMNEVQRIQGLPETPGKWMKYFETSSIDESRILQRVENYLPYSAALDALFAAEGSDVREWCGQLFGEPAVVYKDKINFKLPGSDGFKPHQDHAAGWWMHGHSLHISVLVGVDQQTCENGCLEVVAGQHRRGLLGEEFKEVPEHFVAEFDWKPVLAKLGDVVFFDSYVPHRSAPNTTSEQRRALYLTYNKLSEGDKRDQYYADKRKSFPPDCERDPNKSYEYKI